MIQPVILAVSEPWGFYSTAAELETDRLTAGRMTLNQARDLIRRVPAETRPAVIPSLTELARRLKSAGIAEQTVAIYRRSQDGKPGQAAGAWHLFTYSAN